MSTYSSRIEKLQVHPDRTQFDLDGKSVLLTEENASPALKAFQEFYAAAWEAYATRPAAAAPERKPSFWKTALRSLRPSNVWNGIRSFLAGFLGIASPGAPSSSQRVQTGPPDATVREGGAPAASPARGPAHQVPRASGKEVPPVLPRTAESIPAQKTSVAGGRSGASDHFHLLLRSAYADEHGVHLLWLAGESGREKATELLCSFESPVAERLQHCYSRLSEMGHPVVDLRIWRPQPDPARPLISATVTAAPAKKPEPTAGAIMKLQPGPSDTPGRAVVAPVSDSKALQVLTAPERLIDALHSASAASQPDADRLTYLRCASGRSGLKVIAVGTGENPDEPGTPARWENISTWWEAHKKPAPAPAPAAPPEPKIPSTEPAAELF